MALKENCSQIDQSIYLSIYDNNKENSMQEQIWNGLKWRMKIVKLNLSPYQSKLNVPWWQSGNRNVEIFANLLKRKNRNIIKYVR